jgi:hypothetical protein
MHGVVPGPWPAAELIFAIVAECVFYFFPRVHHERAILGNRLVDGPPLEQEKMTFVVPPFHHHFYFWAKLD